MSLCPPKIKVLIILRLLHNAEAARKKNLLGKGLKVSN